MFFVDFVGAALEDFCFLSFLPADFVTFNDTTDALDLIGSSASLSLSQAGSEKIWVFAMTVEGAESIFFKAKRRRMDVFVCRVK